METALAIETQGLTKAYGGRLALDGLSLEVRRGEAFGLLGPNGAGKSTSVKLLLGLVRPTAGQGRLLGRPLGDIAGRRRVGFLPEHFHFQDWLSGDELLRLHGRLFGIAEPDLRRRIPPLLARVGLDRQGNKPLRLYSKGMRQRIGLAQALLCAPELIFLDEPTSGLDPHGRLLVREIIREQCAGGATVFLNSHLLAEVEACCDRVAFLRDGRLLAVRSLSLGDARAVQVRVRAHGWDQPRFLEAANHAALPALLAGLVQSGVEVYEFTPQAPSLEEAFLQVVGSEGGVG